MRWLDRAASEHDRLAWRLLFDRYLQCNVEKTVFGTCYDVGAGGSGLGGMLFQWLSGRMVDRFGYYPVFLAYGIMPLIAVARNIKMWLLGLSCIHTVEDESETENGDS